MARLDVLAGEITQIEVELDHTDPESFASDTEYDAWRYRAKRALGHTKREVQFLKAWVRRCDEECAVAQRVDRQAQKTAAMAEQADVVRQLTGIVDQVRSRAEELATEIRREYAPVYDASHLPDDLEVARERTFALQLARQRVQLAIVEIHALITAHPIKKVAISGVKESLVRLLTEIEQEAVVVRRFQKEKEQERVADGVARRAEARRVHEATVPPNGWRAVFMGALTRALEQGFVLTPEEQTVFDQVQARSGGNT